MPAYIHQINTAVPPTSYQQDFTRDLMKANISDDRRIQSLIHRIYSRSGIAKRHSVIRDFNLNGHPALFFDEAGNALPRAGTKARNEAYIREARPLYCKLAEDTIANAPDFDKEDITHVITVSCTGFFAPGPDFHIVKELGLHPSTQRYHLGFMGCYAAFPALKMARAFCAADPSSVVLVVCLELCTLHLQLREEADFIISGSVFSDGAGSALVSAIAPGPESRALMIKQLGSDLTPDGEHDMAWTIGDTGFDMTLSSYIPGIIKANIPPVIGRQLARAGLTGEDIGLWAVHPGGRAILDKIQQSMQLSDDQIASSRHILREYGNMSSATILFVLKNMLENNPPCQTILAMAFGPGLTIETGIFEVLYAPDSAQTSRALNRANGSARL
ncbi:MAG: 3-oxoacyl-[acyl-carrier-protein] synthase III C-terminal domain-containing protein [Balneolales bacterium]